MLVLGSIAIAKTAVFCARILSKRLPVSTDQKIICESFEPPPLIKRELSGLNTKESIEPSCFARE